MQRPRQYRDFVSGAVLGNAFEPVLRRREPAVEAVFAALAQIGTPRLTGSGSGCFVEFADRESAEAALAGVAGGPRGPGWRRARRVSPLHAALDANRSAGASPSGPRHRVLILAFAGSNPAAPANTGSGFVGVASCPGAVTIPASQLRVHRNGHEPQRTDDNARRSQPAGLHRQRQPAAGRGGVQGTRHPPGQGAGQRASPTARCRSRSRRTCAGRKCS